MGEKTSYLDLAKRIIDKRGTNPLYLIHYVTTRCNLKCQHCFYWESLNTGKYELTLEEHQKISASMGKLAFLSLTGGEPFLRQELPQIAETYCNNNGVRKLAIPTNGWFTQRVLEGVKYILENCGHTSVDINISVDGIGEDHDEIRGQKGSFDKAMKTYDGLKELKKEFNRLGITILTTVNAKNQYKIMDIYNYMKNNLTEAVFSVNLVRGGPLNPEIADVDIKQYELITKAIIDDYRNNSRFNKNASLAKISAAKNVIRDDVIAETYKNKEFISQCYAAQLSGVMYENGDIFCCELLNKKIGNVKDYDYDFGKLWTSDKATEIIKFIKDTKCFCTHECFWTTNILFNPRYYPRLLVESARL